MYHQSWWHWWFTLVAHIYINFPKIWNCANKRIRGPGEDDSWSQKSHGTVFSHSKTFFLKKFLINLRKNVRKLGQEKTEIFPPHFKTQRPSRISFPRLKGVYHEFILRFFVFDVNWIFVESNSKREHWRRNIIRLLFVFF